MDGKFRIGDLVSESEFRIGDLVSEREGARKFGLITALRLKPDFRGEVVLHAEVLWRDSTSKVYPILFLEAAKENH